MKGTSYPVMLLAIIAVCLYMSGTIDPLVYRWHLPTRTTCVVVVETGEPLCGENAKVFYDLP